MTTSPQEPVDSNRLSDVSRDGLLQLSAPPRARFLIMSRLFELLHNAFFVALLLEPAKRLLKRLTFLHSNFGHPTQPPSIQRRLAARRFDFVVFPSVDAVSN